MVEKKTIDNIARFFLLSVLNDDVAIKSSIKVIKKYNRRLHQRQTHEESSEKDVDLDVLLIRLLFEQWQKSQRKSKTYTFDLFLSNRWVLPQNINLNPWKELTKRVSSNELICLILFSVLSYPEHKIAEALNISTGTVRYRAAHALRTLVTKVPLSFEGAHYNA